MSQPTFPFDVGAVLPEDPADDPAPASRRRILLVAALGVTGLATGAFLLLGSGSEADELALGVPPGATAPASPASPAATPSPDAGADVSQVPPPADAVQLGRNPFVPLVQAAGPASAPTVPAGTGSEPTEIPITAPTAPGADLPDGSGLPPGPAGPGVPAPVTGPAGPLVGPQVPTDDGGAPGPVTTVLPTAVVLTRVTGAGAERSAVLSLDGTSWTVAVGDSFGPGKALQLVSVQQGPDDGQWTAVLRAGSSDPFDVVSGVRTPLP